MLLPRAGTGGFTLGLSAETTSPGLYARLLAYDPAADAVSEIADLADILPEPPEPQRHPHSKIHTSICAGADGKIYTVTHMTARRRARITFITFGMCTMTMNAVSKDRTW